MRHEIFDNTMSEVMADRQRLRMDEVVLTFHAVEVVNEIFSVSLDASLFCPTYRDSLSSSYGWPVGVKQVMNNLPPSAVLPLTAWNPIERQ